MFLLAKAWPKPGQSLAKAWPKPGQSLAKALNLIKIVIYTNKQSVYRYASS
jgi:hypothetical protein